MSYKSFNQRREMEVKEEEQEDEMMQVDEKPRRWYKHVYKSSCKGNFRRQKSSGEEEREKDREHSLDLRSRAIDRNRRDTQLQKEYMAKLSALYFPKSEGVRKTFEIAVDPNEGRLVQLKLQKSK